ncbi:MAG TPA: carboxypeptidase-like regulatory domain-containing protein, partial [Puia sp.]|nr:carboxypeptidase-like regulatory domain-containing protein [Puia sp.]
MKKILCFLLAASLKLSVFAQMSVAGPGNGKMQAPSIGHIYGKLIDSTGKPLSDVSVILLQNRFDSASKKAKDVLLKALTTKANGEFNFEELPVFGKLKLKISAMGFKPLEQSVSFRMQMPAGSVS